MKTPGQTAARIKAASSLIPSTNLDSSRDYRANGLDLAQLR